MDMGRASVTVAGLAGLAVILAMAGPAVARDQIRIVGSSTVFPFASTVVERFGQKTGNPTPVIESTGSGGGLQLFCAGVGEQHPDITNSSRRIKQSEVDTCAQNGVKEITEVKIGFDGIVLANSKNGPAASFTIPQLWQALAKEVPVDGELKPNPYQNWSEIDPSLPDEPIEVLGPPPTSGTRDAFVELVMLAGCEEFDAVKALPGDQMEQVCATMREDGRFIEAGENDNLIVRKLERIPPHSASSASASSIRTATRSRAARSAMSSRRSRTSLRATTRSRARSTSTSRTRTSAWFPGSRNTSRSSRAKMPWASSAIWSTKVSSRCRWTSSRSSARMRSSSNP
jgi:ABC-type phosphate transport system substrate-binding protein